MRLALIDHYDSFTFNVLEWLRVADPTLVVEYVTHDDAPALGRLLERPIPLVLSPGPGRPEAAAATLALVGRLLGRVPILGICLGHQLLGRVGGAAVVRSREPHHGTTRRITPRPGAALFAGMPAAFDAGVYHSLVVDPSRLAAPWTVDAVDELGEVQALARVVPGEAPAFGVQFHPESHLSELGATLAANWLSLVARHQASATEPLSMPS